MKKSYIFIIALLFVSTFFLSNSYAEVLPTDSLQNQASNVQNNLEQIPRTQEDIRSQYLQKEWGSLFRAKLEKNSFGKGLLAISDFIADSHIFKVLLGVEYSWTWVFVFAFGIWLAFIFLFYPPFSIMLKNKIIGVLVAIVTASLIGISGAIKTTVTLLSSIVNSLSLTLVAIVVLIIINILFSKVGKQIKYMIKNAKNKSAKEQTQADRKILHTEAKFAKKKLDSLKDGSGI